jgi:hypothetical protein
VEFLKRGGTVNLEQYVQTLRELKTTDLKGFAKQEDE